MLLSIQWTNFNPWACDPSGMRGCWNLCSHVAWCCRGLPWSWRCWASTSTGRLMWALSRTSSHCQPLCNSAGCWAAWVMLGMGPGNPSAVQVWTAKRGQFGSRPVQKPDPLNLGGPNPDPYPSTGSFHEVWLDPSCPIFGSACQVSHALSHSDMLLIIVKDWHWYITVYFRCIGRLSDQNERTCASYLIMILNVNGASTIIGLASLVIWVALDHKHPYRRGWQPL